MQLIMELKPPKSDRVWENLQRQLLFCEVIRQETASALNLVMMVED